MSSVFAWYTVANTKIIGEISNTLTISSKTNVTMEDKIAIATVAGTNSDLALTKATGASTVKSVALVNGTKELPETNTNKYGTLTISVDWKATENDYTAPTTDEKAALDGISVTFTIEEVGNVVLLSSAARTGNTNEVGNIVVTATWDNTNSRFNLSAVDNNSSVVTLGGAGSNEIYFAVQPNNDSGPEWIHADEIGTGKKYATGTSANPHKTGESIDPLEGDGAYANYHTNDGVAIVANPAA